MSNLNGVNIKRGKVGANVLGSDDAISGIIITSPAVASLPYSTPAVVYNLGDVETLGITADFDSINNVHVYEHLKEFYRLAGSGTELHVMLLPQTAKLVEQIEIAGQQLLVSANGKIKQLAFAVNLESSATVTMLNGLPDDVYNSIAKAKALENWSEDHFMPVVVYLEGYAWSGNAASSADLRDIENLSAEGVSVVIGQDKAVADTKTGHAKKYAFVGTVLGVTASCTVQQNIGENETKNLTGLQELLNPGLSDNKSINEDYSQLQTLEDKGYIFGITYTGMAGVRLNNDHVCSPIVLDADNSINEHSIAFSRVGKKARRQLRTAYLPKIKTDWQVNEETGKLSPASIVALEEIGNQVLGEMQKRGEITSGIAIVDASSDLIVEKLLKVSYKIVPRGSIGEISGFINLKTKI